MNAADIVAYTGDAENLCPPCAARSVGWSGVGNPHIFIETVGLTRGINVHNEHSFDSSQWPKVIFASQIEDTDERCAVCTEPFVG